MKKRHLPLFIWLCLAFPFMAMAQVEVDPTFFDVTLNYGDSITLPLTVTNNGGGELEFTIDGIPLLTEKSQHILALINGADTQGYPKTIAAIDAFYTSYQLTEITTIDPLELEDALSNKNILLIPEQDICDGASFTAFAPVVQAFVNNGGTVIQTGSANEECIFNLGLMTGSYQNFIFSQPVDVLLPDDPLAMDVSPTFNSLVATFYYNITNPDKIKVIDFDGNDIVTYRNIGEGKSILIGFDYFQSNDDMKRVIANAVQSSGSGTNGWLFLSDTEDTLDVGETITIDVEFNATNVFGGTYMQDIILETNDLTNPQIIVPATLTVIGEADISISQMDFDLGDWLVGATNSASLTISNPGTDSLFITDISSSDPQFTISPETLSLYGGTESELIITFNPAMIGDFNGEITLTTNVGVFIVTVSGTGIGAPTVLVDPTEFNVTLNTGESGDFPLLISNIGEGPMEFTAELASSESWLDLSPNAGNLGFPDDLTVTLSFNTDGLLGGLYTTDVIVTTNDPLMPTIVIPVNFTVVGIPAVTVSELALDYGDVLLGAHAERTITISNPGTDALNIVTTLPPFSDYTSSVTTATIPPGEEMDVTINFDPTIIQNYDGNFIFITNAGDVVLALTGEGIGAPTVTYSPTSFDITLLAGDSTTEPFTLNNSGEGPLNFNITAGSDLEILALTYAVDEFTSYPGTLDALNAYLADYNLTELNTTNPTALATALNNKDILLIPQQLLFEADPTVITALGGPMQDFANAGGTVIFLGNDCGSCVINTGLFSGFFNYSLYTSNQITVINPSDPIMAGVAPAFIPPPTAYIYGFTNSDLVTLAEGPFGGEAIAYREVGDGRAVYIGFNYTGVDDNVGLTLANAAALGKQGLPDWLNLSVVDGSINFPGTLDIDLTFDATGMIAGVYEFDLTITTNDPLVPEVVVPITLTVQAFPQALFEANSTLSCDGIVTFEDFSVNDPTSWSWDFGDGNMSSSPNPTNIYETPGTYTVSLEVCNDLGCDDAVFEDYILVDFTLDYCDTTSIPNSGTEVINTCSGVIYDSGGTGNTLLNIDATLTIAPVGASSIMLEFSSLSFENCCDYIRIYDGVDVATGVQIGGNYKSMADLPADGIIIASSGAVTIVEHTDGSQSLAGFKATYQCELITGLPNSNFAYEITDACSGIVEFTEISSQFPSEWTWDFGDGNTSTEQNPTHSYLQSGSYDVTLEACNIVGCASFVQTVTVEGVLFVDFEVATGFPGLNDPVLLIDHTIGANSWEWDFGNGTIGIGVPTPVTFYSTPGFYTISLTVTNAEGCTRTGEQVLQVVSVIGIEELELGTLDLYPNPTTGILNLNYEFEGMQNLNVHIFDMVGKAIHQEQTTAVGTYQTQFDFSTKAKGIYIVSIQTDKGTLNQKVVVH